MSLALAETLPGDGLMGEEDSGPLAASPELASAVLDRVQEQRPGVTLPEVLEALDRCDDPGGPGRRWWTLDPVDGTKGFLRNEQYAVALALIEDGEVVLAVMGCPNLPLEGEPGAAITGGSVGCLLRGRAGRGAQMLRCGMRTPDARWPIHRSGRADIGSARPLRRVGRSGALRPVGVCAASARPWASPPNRCGWTARPSTPWSLAAMPRSTCACRVATTARTSGTTRRAHLIVTEAGGRVSDVEGRPLDFTTGTRMTANRGIVAAAAPIHGEVVAAVRSVLER